MKDGFGFGLFPFVRAGKIIILITGRAKCMKLGVWEVRSWRIFPFACFVSFFHGRGHCGTGVVCACFYVSFIPPFRFFVEFHLS